LFALFGNSLIHKLTENPYDAVDLLAEDFFRRAKAFSSAACSFIECYSKLRHGPIGKIP